MREFWTPRQTGNEIFTVAPNSGGYLLAPGVAPDNDFGNMHQPRCYGPGRCARAGVRVLGYRPTADRMNLAPGSRAAPSHRKARFRRSLATQRPHSGHMLCRSNGLIVEIIC